MKCEKHGIEMVEEGGESCTRYMCLECEHEKETGIEAQNEPDEWGEPPIVCEAEKHICDHDWEELWDDEVGQRCCVCMICDEYKIFQYDVEKRNLENRIVYLEEQLQECADVLNVFAQFANIKAHEHEHVTIVVNIDTLREAKHLLGGAFRDLTSDAHIPV